MSDVSENEWDQDLIDLILPAFEVLSEQAKRDLLVRLTEDRCHLCFREGLPCYSCNDE